MSRAFAAQRFLAGGRPARARGALVLLLAPVVLLAGAVGVQAEPLRRVVVPADASVVVPPRGQPMPPQAATRPKQTMAPGSDAAAASVPHATASRPVGLAPALPALLPLGAAALLASGLPGSGGGASAPASTR